MVIVDPAGSTPCLDATYENRGRDSTKIEWLFGTTVLALVLYCID